MAEEPQYASKRKFDDPPPAAAPGRPKGFSAPISTDTPPAAASSAAAPAATLPVDGIELAKQRAQEIASRLFTSAEAKRPKLEKVGSADDLVVKGFGSAAPDYSQKPLAQPSPSQVGMTLPSSFPAYGFPGSSKKIEIPNGRVGVIIGKGGETIRYLQLQSGAKIQVTRDMDHDPNSQTRPVELIGTPDQISKAEQLIIDVLSEADTTGGSGTNANRKFSAPLVGGEQFIMKVPTDKVGLVIGKGGETIKNMQAKSGARIQLIPLHPPPGDTSTERTVQIDGTQEQIELAKQLVNEVISAGSKILASLRDHPMVSALCSLKAMPERRVSAAAATGRRRRGTCMSSPSSGSLQPSMLPLSSSADCLDYSQKPLAQPSPSQVGMTLPSSFPAYGFPGSSKKIEIPNGRVGVIIGKGGETIRYLQLQSGAKIQVTRDMDHDPNSQTRPVELIGTPDQISKAEQLIIDVLSEADTTGGSGTNANRKFSAPLVGGEQFIMKVPTDKVGLVIGKGGETIKNMQAKSGARIQLIPLHPPPGDTSTERTVQIDGTQEQIELAKQLVNEVISANRFRNPQTTGGYPQPGYRPPRPPTSWGPPGAPQMQQPGYGYMQPGAYTGAPPPYNTPQPPYGGYPPLPASGGFTSGWYQSSNPVAQQSTPASGYDYYHQQPQQQPPPPIAGSSAPANNTSYNYNQPPANSQGSYGDSSYPPSASGLQGYGQDGYSGGYQAPTNQQGYPQTNAQTGYDQQGYGMAQPAYGAMTSSTQDGSASKYTVQDGPTQVPPLQQAPPSVQPSATHEGYAGQPPSATTASYPSQGTTQTVYSALQILQPVYGSHPLAQSEYGQPTPTSQPSYIPPAYGQPPPAQSGYGFAHGGPQPTYGQQPSHGGVAPQSQPTYGQQQQQKPAAYSNDNSVNGAYDALAATQPVPSGVTKASSQS